MYSKGNMNGLRVTEFFQSLQIHDFLTLNLYKKFPILTLWASTPQNDQTHSDNSSAFADELFEYVWRFSGDGA